MPKRTNKTSGPTRDRKTLVKATSVPLLGKVKAKRIQETGLTSRIAGHVSARGKRAQAKKDSR